MCPIKKKDDSEIIKSNIPIEIINNGNENYQVEITKQNNKEEFQNKNIINQDSKKPSVLNINNYVKNSDENSKKKKSTLINHIITLSI